MPARSLQEPVTTNRVQSELDLTRHTQTSVLPSLPSNTMCSSFQLTKILPVKIPPQLTPAELGTASVEAIFPMWHLGIYSYNFPIGNAMRGAGPGSWGTWVCHYWLCDFEQ
jgi:hypothetical protein